MRFRMRARRVLRLELEVGVRRKRERRKNCWISFWSKIFALRWCNGIGTFNDLLWSYGTGSERAKSWSWQAAKFARHDRRRRRRGEKSFFFLSNVPIPMQIATMKCRTAAVWQFAARRKDAQIASHESELLSHPKKLKDKFLRPSTPELPASISPDRALFFFTPLDSASH